MIYQSLEFFHLQRDAVKRCSASYNRACLCTVEGEGGVLSRASTGIPTGGQ